MSVCKALLLTVSVAQGFSSFPVATGRSNEASRWFTARSRAVVAAAFDDDDDGTALFTPFSVAEVEDAVEVPDSSKRLFLAIFAVPTLAVLFGIVTYDPPQPGEVVEETRSAADREALDEMTDSVMRLRGGSRVRLRGGSRVRAAPRMGPPRPPPLTDAKRLRFSYKEIAKRAAAGSSAAFAAGHRRVSVEVPQISSVDRSTTARNFEDNNNFLLALVELLGGGKSPAPFGRKIDIKVGGFEAGGDYLSDEGLYGWGWGGTVAVGNSEMDGSALRELPALEKEAAAALGGRPNVLLFNCALSRLSFFDKIGMASLDDVETAYVLRRVGSGFLSRVFPEDYCLWRLEPSGKLALVGSQPQPYAAQEAEATIRGS